MAICNCLPEEYEAVVSTIAGSFCTKCDGGVGMEFVTKDSGVRENFDSGMVRDTQKGKPRYDLIDRPFLKRWAELMARGAEKYGEENWKKAAGEEELKRFKASALRHVFQYLDGDTTEDHAAAVAFNLAGAEHVKAKLNGSR